MAHGELATHLEVRNNFLRHVYKQRYDAIQASVNLDEPASNLS